MIGDDFLNRFGPYRLQDYSVPLYTGGAVGGVPGGGTIGVPGPTPTPAPAPTPRPTPLPGNGNNGGNNPGGSGPGGRGNEGGASHGVGGGGGGDNAGHPASLAGASSAGFDGGLFGGINFGPNQGIDLGPWGAGLLQAASTLAPFPYSLAPTLAQLGMRGFNLMNANAVRGSLGVPDTDIGQAIGALLGLNDYASLAGNQTIANRDQFSNPITGKGVAVTQGGYYDPGFLQRLFTGDAAGTAYTPEEARLHQMLAKAPSATAAAPNFNFNDPVYGGGKEGGLIGYRQKDGTIANPPSAGDHQSNGAFGNSGRSSLGGGTMSNPGGGTTAAGGAGTGGLNNGFGGGGYAEGGYVRGRPDRIPDNRRIAANEGEFVVRNAAAKVAGPALLGLVNTPAGARRVRQALGL